MELDIFMEKKSDKFSDIVRELRLAKNLSLRQLAAKIINKKEGKPISPSYLYDIENSNRIPSADIIMQIANELGYDEDKLLNLAQKISPDAEKLLKEDPAVGELLRKAKESGFRDWEKLRKIIEENRDEKDT